MNSQKMAFWLACGWIAVLLLAAFLAPSLLREQAEKLAPLSALEPPSAAHFLGTDALGRDLLCRLALGAYVTMRVSITAALLAVMVGALLGAFAAYAGKWADKALLAAVDIFLCFPTFFLILAVVAILGPSPYHLIWIIGLTGWMGTARLVRAEVLSLKEREFILASRVMGAGGAHIVFRHLLPNALPPILVSAILGVSSAILLESGLSFLGVGVQPPTPSWGNLLMDGKAALGVAWWLTFFPGAAIFLTVLSANAIGESLQKGFGRE